MSSFLLRSQARPIHFLRGYSTGNRVKLLINGDETFPAMLQAIADAEQMILMESYIFRMDKIGEKFLAAFAEASSRGVQILVHIDGLGSWPYRTVLREAFEQINATLRFFHPVTASWGTWKYFSRRNHRKILVIDNRIVFLGGVNIGIDYIKRDQGGLGVRDTNVSIEGPVVTQATTKFFSLWNRQRPISDRILGAAIKNPVPHHRGCLVKILGNNFFFKRYVIRNAYRRMVSESRIYIRITNPYFIPDKWLLASLYQAVGRGVRVEIILPHQSNLPIIGRAMKNLYTRMLRHGIRIYEWKPDFIHAKTAVVDTKIAIVGSFNWDRISLLKNLEIVSVIRNRNFCSELNEAFEQDLQFCQELRLDQWLARPLYFRFLEHLAYMFRWWL